MARWRYRGFGLHVECGFPLPGMRPLVGQRHPDVVLRLAQPGEIARVFSGAGGTPLWQTVLGDGCTFRVQLGRLGDRLFVYGDRAAFHLSPDARTLICDPSDPGDPGWQRQLLDTVLLSVSHQHGFELLHAGAVQQGDGVMAIAAPSGGGKTSLAAALVKRGRPLFADDILALRRRDGRILAHPAPAVMNVAQGQPGAIELGRPLAAFDDEGETWIEVDRSAQDPAELTAVVLLQRRPGAATTLDRLAANPLHLLQHSVGYRESSARHRSCFALFSDVAAATPIFRLQADPATPPEMLADELDRVLVAGDEAGLDRVGG